MLVGSNSVLDYSVRSTFNNREPTFGNKTITSSFSMPRVEEVGDVPDFGSADQEQQRMVRKRDLALYGSADDTTNKGASMISKKSTNKSSRIKAVDIAGSPVGLPTFPHS